ncbi:alpha/beta fold hydrolase [Mucilaginibacter psychrotolerans]|uniref:Alpha/beta hydrolase n=1 Tax=Mucilaginibacter psychrotolerans TaxID=1524096 RepID=A0A4Y8S9A4_9SPHI|nr:alpha/beta hydrolase [Mucilaginibacter psychrotolerans]TFF35482.1 alpha/beta hydrolase [Mucilaginibacter psychrotolerans]
MNEQEFNYVSVPTKYIEVDDIRYAYRSLGTPAEVPVVCLQHFTGTLENWDPIIIDGLAKERQVILIDNTGVGNSGGKTPDNVLDMSKDAIKVINALGIHQCDILGFSLGGFLAQAMADLRPELFRKLIIVGAAPQGAKALHSFPQLVEKAFALEPKEQYLYVFATKSEKSRAKITSTLNRLYIRKEERDQNASMDAITAQISALTRWGTDPVTIDLSKITQPVLIVQGSNDEMMDSASSLELYKSIPNAILIYYPDSAHGSFNQYPELFVEQANSFLNRFE